MKKSIIEWMNKPYCKTTPRIGMNRPVKSRPFNNIPSNCVMMFSTNDDTIFPNAAPITTAIARSSTFP